MANDNIGGKTMMKRFYAAAWIVVYATLALPASSQGTSDAPIRAVIDKYFAAFNSGDLPTVIGLWRADAIEINFRGLSTNKARRDEHFADDLRHGVKFEHKIHHVQVDNQIAWVAGPYTVTAPSQEGGSTQSNGNYLHVLRQEGGTWKLQAASWTRTNQPKKE